jgi:hypothetical protein
VLSIDYQTGALDCCDALPKVIGVVRILVVRHLEKIRNLLWWLEKSSLGLARMKLLI